MVPPVDSMALARVGICCRCLLREASKGVFRGVVQPGWIEGCVGAKRHLLPDDAIKLRTFQQKKLSVAHLATGIEGNYIELFSQKLQKEGLILRDELKLLLHLCQSAEDMAIARDAIYRYNKENQNLMSGDFRFGTIFMRLCYELRLEDLAAATITDERMRGFFLDTTSFNIAIDMLFTKGSYDRALEVLRSMRSQGVTFNRNTLTLAFATCYKRNTPESYRMSSDMMEEAQSKGAFIPRRAYCFAAALALRQNEIEKAQSLYLQIMHTDSRLCQNLRVLLLAMSGAVADAIAILSAAMLSKRSFVRKPEFSQEVVDVLRLRSEGQPQVMEQVEQVLSQLKRADQVTQQTLDDMLCFMPPRKRHPGLEERTSRRTPKPLHSTLQFE